jgi:S-adenosyl methyltransferase
MEMTSHEAPAHDDGGTTESPPFDTSVAHQARMYDYLLGGKDNYAADRAAADEMIRIWPQLAFGARANRAFLGRAVRYLAAEAGIRQFLDIGTGIPTAGNTHEVAQAIAPQTRVAYVDYDPLVLTYAQALLASSEQGATGYIHADLRDTGTVLAQAAELLDFTQPVAVTMLAILYVIPDSDDPHAIVARLLDAVPSGSYLAISHPGSDLYSREALEDLMDVADRKMQQQAVFRTREQVARFFEGTDLVEPGLVRIEEWRPEPSTDWANKSAGWCAVGRKR